MGTSFSASLLRNRGLCPNGVGLGSREQGNRIVPPSSFKLPELPASVLRVTATKALGSSSVESSVAPFCRLENGGPKRQHESPRSQCSSLVGQRLRK